MVLIDGLPIVSGLSTVYGFSGIPQFLIERVEIVKGQYRHLYGSEAIGGVINLITKLPENTSTLNVESFVSGWGEVNTDIGIKYRLSNNSSGLLGINYFNYSNPIDKNQDGFTDLTLQDRISIFNKIKIGNKFNIVGRYLYEDRWGGQMNWSREKRGVINIWRAFTHQDLSCLVIIDLIKIFLFNLVIMIILKIHFMDYYHLMQIKQLVFHNFFGQKY